MREWKAVEMRKGRANTRMAKKEKRDGNLQEEGGNQGKEWKRVRSSKVELGDERCKGRARGGTLLQYEPEAASRSGQVDSR